MKLSRSDADVDADADLTAIWIITYSDMVTLLLAFFLLMFSFSLVGEEKRRQMTEALRTGGDVAETSDQDLERTARDIAARLELGGEQGVWVDTTEKEVTIGLPSGITFASGQATLTPLARRQLVAVAPLLGKLSNTIRVEGHTDSVPMLGGEFPTNWHLSAARAQAVVRMLLDAGVRPHRLEVIGCADGKPRASNATEEGRRANRRIEIKLIRAEK